MHPYHRSSWSWNTSLLLKKEKIHSLNQSFFILHHSDDGFPTLRNFLRLHYTFILYNRLLRYGLAEADGFI